MRGKKIAHEHAFVTIFRPAAGVLHHGIIDPEGTHILLFAYREMRPVVVQHHQCGKRTLAVGHEQVGGYAGVGRDIELYFLGAIAVALFGGDDLVIEIICRTRCALQTLRKNFPRLPAPFRERLYSRIAPCVGKGQFTAQGFVIDRHVFYQFVTPLRFLLRRQAQGRGNEQRQDNNFPFHGKQIKNTNIENFSFLSAFFRRVANSLYFCLELWLCKTRNRHI